MIISNDITYGSVWNTLNAIEVDVEQKGKFSYLAWSDAWKILMDHFPFATYEFQPETYESNGTVMSHCTISIGSLERSMWLPVMDSRNNSIPNPSTRQIQDTRMRCLVKCLAMYGLGAYIYRGEELPDAAKDSSEAEIVREKFEYEFVKTGGEIIGANDSDTYFKLIAPLLNNPNNVLHKKLYIENKARIIAAQESAGDILTERYLNIHTAYSDKKDESS